MNTTKFFSWAFLAVAFFIFIFFSKISSLITDWWWFSEVGFTQIFLKSLYAKVAVGFSAGFIAAVFLLGNFLIAVRSKVPWMALFAEALFRHPISLDDRKVKKFGVV